MRFQIDALLSLGAALLSSGASAVPASTTSSYNTTDSVDTLAFGRPCRGFPHGGGIPTFPMGSEPSGTPAPQAWNQLERTYLQNTRKALSSSKGNCTTENIAIRKSWDRLSADERKDYLRAVSCLAKKPAKTSKSLAPGIVNRLDDFTYIHINQTNIIHVSGQLLPWHRVFVQQMEDALKNECGYKGYMPYWDQGRFSENQLESPVFDGSDTSFGGNGKAVPHQPFNGLLPGLVVNVTLPRPAGSGGGCITDGPFKDLQLSLGPIVVPHPNASNIYGYQPNPRCMKRDFFQPASAGNLSWASLTSLVQEPTIHDFRSTLEAGIHPSGHIAIGGDAADSFSTPNDPAFYMLHAQIDRLWAVWQGQDLASRTYAIDGYRTFAGIPLASAPNVPPSNATLSDTMYLVDGEQIPIRQGLSYISEGRCYMYV